MQQNSIEHEREQAEQVPVTARVPCALRDELIARAVELDMSMSGIVRQALRRYLADREWGSN